METSAQPDRRSMLSLPVRGSQRLALWKAAQKQLRGKLNPEEVTKMRKEWEQAAIINARGMGRQKRC